MYISEKIIKIEKVEMLLSKLGNEFFGVDYWDEEEEKFDEERRGDMFYFFINIFIDNFIDKMFNQAHIKFKNFSNVRLYVSSIIKKENWGSTYKFTVKKNSLIAVYVYNKKYYYSNGKIYYDYSDLYNLIIHIDYLLNINKKKIYSMISKIK